QPQVSRVLGLQGEEGVAAMPIASALGATSTLGLHVTITQPSSSSSTSNTRPAAGAVSITLISRTDPLARPANAPIPAPAGALQDLQAGLGSARPAGREGSQTTRPTSPPLARRDEAGGSSSSRLASLASQP